MSRSQTGESGQSMVEFAMVVGVFLLVVFVAVSAALHSVQRASGETAAAAGVQLAASGSANDPATPAYGASYGPTRQLLQAVMWDTTITQGDQAACNQMGQAVSGGGQADG